MQYLEKKGNETFLYIIFVLNPGKCSLHIYILFILDSGICSQHLSLILYAVTNSSTIGTGVRPSPECGVGLLSPLTPSEHGSAGDYLPSAESTAIFSCHRPLHSVTNASQFPYHIWGYSLFHSN